MKIISILTPGNKADRSDFERLSLSEEKRVWELYTTQRLREMYFQQDPIKVLLVWEAESKDQVREWLDSLPMVRENLFVIELIAMGPWVPLQVLFGPTQEQVPPR
jgi:hypothetical protein